METLMEATGTRIIPPDDFPVKWENPGDENYHWTRDREHLPDPFTPMFHSVANYCALEGFKRGGYAYDEAIQIRLYQLINHYNYTRLVPFEGNAEELEARKHSNRAHLNAVALHLKQVWKEEWLPQLERRWGAWEAFDLRGASMSQLISHFEESLEGGIDLYRIHYLMGPPMWFAIDEFTTYYCDLFPGQNELDAHCLLQGFDNKTLEAGRALWQLSRTAQQAPTVAKALEELPSDQVLPALEAQDEAKGFLVEMAVFLRTYGGRSDLWDWGYPSWEDDPTPVVNNLKNYLCQAERDITTELAKAAAEREAAVAAARAALEGYPQPVVERFEQLMEAAQTALVLTENHTFYIDFNGFGWLHRLIREFGNRFATQGRLESAQDIFYLVKEELLEMTANPTVALSQKAKSRREEIERWRGYEEPLELGTRPTQALSLYSPDSRRVAKYSGSLAAEEDGPVKDTPSNHQLHGQAGSSGKVTGRARVITSLSQAHLLQPGEILVTPTTAPPWTPLFLTAAALVTDAGGLLSHGAVVAREYRLPAVVGTHNATRLIRDGQWLEVDGSQGLVTLLD